MIKTLSILISAMVLLIVSLFRDSETSVSVTANVATKVVPGDDCMISLTIASSGVTGYARLQQVLPHGLKATAVESMGAQFEVEENIVKYTWTDLPGDQTFMVCYKIQTDPNETEVKEIPGSLFYTANNETVQLNIDPVSLDLSGQQQSAANKEVERKIFAVTPESGEYKVELTIYKKEGEHSARYVDNIPEGYTVTTISTNGATFMFSNRQAVFQWTKLPEGPVFKISYHLNATGTEHVSPVITGMLVYDGDASSQVNVASAATTKDPVIPAETPIDLIASNLEAQETEKATYNNPTTYIPAPQKGIFFKVQVAATRKSPVRPDQYFQKRYHLGQHVDLAEQDGWRKYMIGQFDTYASAKEFNQITRQKVPDAFVVAYRNGERITIKEAVGEIVKAD